MPKVTDPPKRRPVTLVAGSDNVIALCDDGTLWMLVDDAVSIRWEEAPAIPQPEE